MESWRLGGELWGWFDGAELVSLCYAGANLVTVEATPDAIVGFAERAQRQGRRCSSLVGPAEGIPIRKPTTSFSCFPVKLILRCAIAR